MIRKDIKEALDDYASKGHLPGDFLKSVLRNDLKEAHARADDYNRETLNEIVSYIYNYLPSTCWGSEEKVNDLLMKWGFYKEIEASRSDEEISQSEGFKIGYDWAKKQNYDYLMQHFGLYFDQWNEKGLGKVSEKELEKRHHNGQTVPIFEGILPSKELRFLESDNGKDRDSLSVRKTMLAGILTAVKEANL